MIPESRATGERQEAWSVIKRRSRGKKEERWNAKLESKVTGIFLRGPLYLFACLDVFQHQVGYITLWGLPAVVSRVLFVP